MFPLYHKIWFLSKSHKAIGSYLAWFPDAGWPKYIFYSLSWFCPFPVFSFHIHCATIFLREDFYILAYIHMRSSPEKLYRRDESSNTHAAHGEKKSLAYKPSYGINFIEERLFVLKVNEIIDELTQIMTFINELEKMWFENSEVLGQIRDILTKLRSWDRNFRYTKIVHVLTKYLSGIRGFSSTISGKGILFYKRLFESTLVAIMQELDSPEEVH